MYGIVHARAVINVNRLLLILTVATLLGIALTPAATAGPDPNCMPVYREYNAGPITVVQRSTCQYEVHYDEDWEPTDELP